MKIGAKSLVLVFLLLITITLVNADIINEYSDTSCNEVICTRNIYSYQRYYQSNGQWQEINENFNNQNCLAGYDSCVLNNLYQVYIKNNINTANSIKFVKDGFSIEFQPISSGYSASLLSSPQNSNANLNNNIALFPNSFNNIDIKYYYLPRMFKEEIIINSNQIIPPLQLNPLQEDLKIKFKINTNNLNIQTSQGNWNQIETIITQDSIAFTSNNNPLFYLIKPIAYDSGYKYTDLQYELSNTNNELFLTIKVPYNFLINESTVYPVTIDPTITLTDTKTNWNGYIYVNTLAVPNSYLRVSNPASKILVGQYTDLDVTNLLYRAVLEWDISKIPDNIDIIDINLSLLFTEINSLNDPISVFTMVGNSTTYPNQTGDCQGNCNFWIDAGNGTLLNSTPVTRVNSYTWFNLTSNTTEPGGIGNDLEQRLRSGLNWWSVGLKGADLNSQKEDVFSSKDDANRTRRPLLTITYLNVANESEGDTAIQQGIQNKIPNPIVYNEQQVYTRNWNNVQQLGRFDRFAFNSTLNKRWAINYVTSGESFTNMVNISKSLFILEMTDLSVGQITQKVEQFILGTKDL